MESMDLDELAYLDYEMEMGTVLALGLATPLYGMGIKLAFDAVDEEEQIIKAAT